MRIIRDPSLCPPDAKRAVIALGNFDGVHAGHRAILRRTMETARKLGVPAAVMTFEPHPREFFSKDKKRLRMTCLRQKLRLLEECGIEVVFLMRFNQKLAATSAHDFVINVLKRDLQASHVITGYNFAFGKGREGNTETLARYAKEAGFGFTACDPVRVAGTDVSSSAIRELLAAGDVAKANQLLGHPYRLVGRVRAGASIGRTIGFPTANIPLDALFKPRFGVYAVRMKIEGDDTVYDAIANIGVKPTFSPSDPLLEVHIFDFNRAIYNKRVEITFYAFLRDEIRFPNVGALRDQIFDDIVIAQSILASSARTDSKYMFLCGAGVATITLLLDQLSKHLLITGFPEDTHAIEVLPFFNIVRVWNYGISFGMFAGHRQPIVLSVTSLLIVAGLLVWLWRNTSWLVSVALGLIIGGALGNVIDRLRFDAVTDFLDFYIGNYHWPAFNLADSCIFIGVVLLFIHSMLLEPKPSKGPGQ